MFDDFVVRALIAGAGLSLAVGPLGCFVVWRRMAYFGDATAHAALLGVTLALAFNVSVYAGVIAVAVTVAFAVSTLSGRSYAGDTVLGVISHTALAVGLVGASFLPDRQFDLASFLFGDILAVTTADLALVWGGSLSVLALLVWRWSPLLTATLNPELARSSGINARHEQLVLAVCLALVVAVAIKIVGALLIASLLIIPAAAARPLTRSPEMMAVCAVLISVGSVVAGLQASLVWDTPAGPGIVCAGAAAFFATALIAFLKR